MHSSDRTLLSKLGFADADKKDQRHDWACQYLKQPEVALRLAALLPTSQYKWLTREVKCVGSELEVMVRKGEGKYATTIGFIDLSLSFEVFGQTERESTKDDWVYLDTKGLSFGRAERSAKPGDPNAIIADKEKNEWGYWDTIPARPTPTPLFSASGRRRPNPNCIWNDEEEAEIAEAGPIWCRIEFPHDHVPDGVGNYIESWDYSRWSYEGGQGCWRYRPVKIISPRTEDRTMLVEVKIHEVTMGDILRQIDLYREYYRARSSFPDRWVLATAYPLCEDDVSALRDKQIQTVLLGDGFTLYCENRANAKKSARCLEI